MDLENLLSTANAANTYKHQRSSKYYPVLQSTTLVLLPYYKVLLQYYSVLQSTTPVLPCTTKNYSSITLYYKVLLQYSSDRSDHDPRMIRRWKRKPQPASPPRVLFALARSRFYWKLQHFPLGLSFHISPNLDLGLIANFVPKGSWGFWSQKDHCRREKKCGRETTCSLWPVHTLATVFAYGWEVVKNHWPWKHIVCLWKPIWPWKHGWDLAVKTRFRREKPFGREKCFLCTFGKDNLHICTCLRFNVSIQCVCTSCMRACKGTQTLMVPF